MTYSSVMPKGHMSMLNGMKFEEDDSAKNKISKIQNFSAELDSFDHSYPKRSLSPGLNKNHALIKEDKNAINDNSHNDISMKYNIIKDTLDVKSINFDNRDL